MSKTSEPKATGAFPHVERLFLAYRARKEWEAAHQAPLCACHPQAEVAAWKEALRMDAEWETAAEIRHAQNRLAADLVYRLRKLGVSQRAANAVVACDEGRPGVRAVRRWLDSTTGQPKPFLVLLGEAGTGKTVAAAYAVKRMLLEPLRNAGLARETAVWVRSAELAALSNFEASHLDWLERMKFCRLLVLEELGGEALHDSAQARLELLMDERYGANRLTLVTTNADVETFRARVGQRISDRIREAGRVVNCGNVSLRGVSP